MPLPECLLENNLEPISSHIYRLVSITEDTNTHSKIEISLGRIIDIVEEERIFFDTPHVVVFNKIPVEYRFDPSISKFSYNKALDHFRDPAVNRSKDMLSFNNLTRKVSTVGAPCYQNKFRKVCGYVHLPDHSFDLRISVCTTNGVENPDRNPANYIYLKNRDKIFLPCFGGAVGLVKISDLGKINDKNGASSLVGGTGNVEKKANLVFEAKAIVGGLDINVDDFFGILYKLISCGFEKDRLKTS